MTVRRELVLLGGGHSHVEVLRRFAIAPEPGVRLTLVSPDGHTPYSGMLPAHVAGHYRYDELLIDLARLSGAAGARFVRDEAIAIDRRRRRVVCRTHPSISFDLLSIDIGSTPRLDRVDGAAEHAVAVKPIQRLHARWTALLERARHEPRPLTIAMVGGGAAGLELLLSIRHRLRGEYLALGRDPEMLTFRLFQRGPALLPTHAPGAGRYFSRLLRRRGIEVHTGAAIVRVEADALHDADGRRFAVDETLWATQAGGAPWLAQPGLTLYERGFIRVRDTLQSLDDPAVFAAGDVASPVGLRLEKSGVVAVRQGAPLADNLRARLRGKPLSPYRPQRRWLALIGTGERHAVASWGAVSLHGAWVWHWKQVLDKRFVARYALPR